MRSTHTFVTMDVSAQTYAEIRAKMVAAGYDHVFGVDAGKETMDMHGLALKMAPAPADEDQPQLDQPNVVVRMRRAELMPDGSIGAVFIGESAGDPYQMRLTLAQARALAQHLEKICTKE